MADKDKLVEAQEKSAERRREKVEEFSDKLVEKLEDKVKCVAVYGSVSRGEHTHESDIDTFVVLDDTKLGQDVPKEAKDKIRKKVTDLAKEVDDKITIQYLSFLTEFWDSIRKGEPLMVSVLRNGETVYDVGIFAPAKRMLERGKIQSSREAVQKRLKLAASGYKKAEKEVKSSIPFKLEQAMANAGQAPVMLLGEMPPEKQDVGDALEKLFIEEDRLEEKYAEHARDIAEFADKGEKHPEEVSAEELEEMMEKTDEFIRRMHELVGEMGGQKKVQQVIKDYKSFLKANVAALKSRDVEPPEDKEDLPDVVSEHLDLSDEDMDLFPEWEEVVEQIKERELEDVDEEDLQDLRARTRDFVSSIGEDLKQMKEEEDVDVDVDEDVEGPGDIDIEDYEKAKESAEKESEE
ncbi:MAG: nucleotidyltransferase domain-containing protein [Candidatus Nanohaloarchaeota archaeon QJJ-7]|nr:nucleotidyltransferase domain-containing protein [Candidatus Nanohaloarchaeota archaeon QJJ-7]